MDISKRRKRSRTLAAAVGVATLTVLVSACSSSSPDVAPAAVSQEDLTQLPEANTFATIADAAKDPQPTGTTDGKVLHPNSDVVVYQGVGGKAIAKLPSIQMGSPTWVPVIAEQGDWAQVLLPARPNAAAGWVHVSSAEVVTANNDYVINVNRETFSLDLLQDGKSVGTWKIGTGKPEHPTPQGRAFVMASLEETVNTYSPIVLPLSYHSDSLETFGGGPGTVGIHTWPDDSFVGKANSDGCIRVPADALGKLAKVPLGTMVNIV
jgi:lipoprotein-anchoring transpeptidase ErfK/SrfK